MQMLRMLDVDALDVPEQIPHGDMPGDGVTIGQDNIERAKTVLSAIQGTLERRLEESAGGRVVIGVCGEFFEEWCFAYLDFRLIFHIIETFFSLFLFFSRGDKIRFSRFIYFNIKSLCNKIFNILLKNHIGRQIDNQI